jgi:hypothetical protein
MSQSVTRLFVGQPRLHRVCQKLNSYAAALQDAGKTQSQEKLSVNNLSLSTGRLTEFTDVTLACEADKKI